MLVESGEITKKFSSLVKPRIFDHFGVFFHEKTSISIEDLQKANDFKRVWAEFEQFSAYSWLAAWKGSYDQRAIHHSYQQSFNCPWKPVRPIFDIWPFAVAAQIGLGVNPSFDLSRVCARFGTKLPTHSAVEDAEATAIVFANLTSLLELGVSKDGSVKETSDKR